MLPTSRQRDIAIFVVNRTHHVITAFRLRIKLRKQVDPGFNQDVSPSSASSVSEPETPSDEFQMVHRKRSVRRGKKQQRPPLVVRHNLKLDDLLLIVPCDMKVSLSASLDSQVSLETEEGGPLAQVSRMLNALIVAKTDIDLGFCSVAWYALICSSNQGR